MRFGIFDHNDASGRPPAEQIAERLALVDAYEGLGYRAYHMAEHHGTTLGITPSPHLVLAAASQRTSVIRLGTLISILPLYHPMRVIEEACTLDQLTAGRLTSASAGASPRSRRPSTACRAPRRRSGSTRPSRSCGWG